jgi:NADP-dependent 3-hydroxy acid dehydrogenase YdfG
MDRKIALITGATSGIGYATAQLLARNKYNLILTGRRKERLESLRSTIMNETPADVITLNFDIRNRKAAALQLNELPEEWKNVHLLVNNAGLAAGLAPINSADVDDWEIMIDTNIKGLLYVSRIVSEWMVQRKAGHIINISSIAGKESYPNGSVYCGSKHAVIAISKAMRIELLPFGIKVSTISPGAVETEFSLVRFQGDQQKADQVYKGFTPLFAADIAETVLFVASRPAHVNIDDLLIMPTSQGSARDIYRK